MNRLHRPTATAHAALLCLGGLLGGSLHAQPLQGGEYYWGLGVGQSRLRIDDRRVTEDLAARGFATTAIAHDERHVGYKAFVGYQFNRYLAAELGFFDLGKFGYTATTSPAGSLASSFRVQGGNLGIVGTLPMTDNFALLARVGGQYARSRGSLSGTGAVVVADGRPSDRKTNPKIGLGLQYAFSPSVLMRAEVERFRVSDAVGNHPRVAMYSVSLVFPFGGSNTAPRRAMAMPMMERQAEAAAPPPPMAPMAPRAASPAPVMTAEPVQPQPLPAAMPATRRVSYAAESFFSFDSTELRPEGKAVLDTFMAELGNTRFETITVQGHADRLGSTDYNQTLSKARAEAVKAYLVQSGRIDGSRVVATGRSESEPVTLPDACKGVMSAPVIACLQPDRRVEIEVSGSR